MLEAFIKRCVAVGQPNFVVECLGINLMDIITDVSQ